MSMSMTIAKRWSRSAARPTRPHQADELSAYCTLTARNSGTRPALQAVPLGFALLGLRLLEIVSVRCRIERPIGRIGNHDPFAAPARSIFVEQIGRASCGKGGR